MSVPRRLALLALLPALLLPLAAGAIDGKLKIGVFGSGKGSGPLLTRAELRECLALNQAIRGRNEAMIKERDQIEKDKADQLREAEEMKAALDALDRSDPVAVEAIKARGVARDKALDELDAKIQAFNERVETLKGQRTRFAEHCDDRRFDQDDAAAIRAGK